MDFLHSCFTDTPECLLFHLLQPPVLRFKMCYCIKTVRTSSLYKTVMAWFQCGGEMLFLCSLAFSGLFCNVSNYLNHLDNDQPLFLKVRTACFHPEKLLYGCFEFRLILFVWSGCNAERFRSKMVPTGFESLKESLIVNGIMRDKWPPFTKKEFPVMVTKNVPNGAEATNEYKMWFLPNLAATKL